MGYSFDGINKKINLTTGTTEVDVNDMYSRWYDWFVIGDNSKFLPAFRNVGGDQISEIKNLGITFFLINGWRIVPQSADHRLTLNGNLITDPSGYSPIDTVPGYSIIVEYSVSNLVDSTLVQMAEIEYSSFQNGVMIDVVNGVSGTSYPAGTRMQPCNNLADAKAIANERGFNILYVVGELVLGPTDDVSGFIIVGEAPNKTTVTIQDGCLTDEVHFKDCYVSGDLSGGDLDVSHCYVGDLTGIVGHIQQCVLYGDLTISGDTHLYSCYDGIPGSINPIIDCGGSGKILEVRDYFGGITLKNKTGPEELTIAFSVGRLNIEATVTNGTITIRGVGEITSNLGTATIIDSGLVNASKISDVVLDEALADHGIDGSVGKSISEIKDKTTPLTYTIPNKVDASAEASLSQEEHDELMAIRGTDEDTLKTLSDQLDGVESSVGIVDDAVVNLDSDISRIEGKVDTVDLSVDLLIAYIKNKKELVKVGNVWHFIIYAANGTDPIVDKELKDKDLNNITDLASGVLAVEGTSSV